jgi:hypothetical protein
MRGAAHGVTLPEAYVSNASLSRYMVNVHLHRGCHSSAGCGDGSRRVNVSRLDTASGAMPPLPAWLMGRAGFSAPSPVPLFVQRHIVDHVSTCPHPLRLQLRGTDGSLLRARQVTVALQRAHGAIFGIDAVRIRQNEDDGHSEDAEGGHHGFAEFVEFEWPPLEDILLFLTMALTMASSSEFVRSQVDPVGYAAAKAKESNKKEKQLAAAGADVALRKVIATPLLELDINQAMQAIDEAEEQNVQASLIDKAVAHTEKAIEAYMAQ